jgi:hypothetical protein
MKNEKLSTAAGVFTIIGAIATVAGIFIGVTRIIETQRVITYYATTQLLKRDTVVVTIRDTVFIEKNLSGDSKLNFDAWKKQQEQDFEVWKRQQEQDFKKEQAAEEQAFEKFKSEY